jgi:Ribosomal protein TL5, C-terminal domain
MRPPLVSELQVVLNRAGTPAANQIGRPQSTARATGRPNWPCQNCKSSQPPLRRTSTNFSASPSHGLFSVAKRQSSSQQKHQIPLQDPSKFVHGITLDDVKDNASLLEYLQANFPELFVLPPEDSQMALPGSAVETIDEAPAPIASSYPLNIRPLTTFVRKATEDGSRRSRLLRYHDMIPGLLHGSYNLGKRTHHKLPVKTPWNLLQRELDRYHRAFECRVYSLKVLEEETGEATVENDEDGNSGAVVEELKVIPHCVQRHPIYNKVYCVNYVRYYANRPIPIPVAYTNEEESPALKRDGFILPIKRTIEVVVEDGVPIPEKLEVECTGLKFKEVIRLDRVMLPQGVSVTKRVLARGKDFLIGVVHGRNRGGAADDDDEVSKDAKKAADGKK